jgi:hypothetical protein
VNDVQQGETINRFGKECDRSCVQGALPVFWGVVGGDDDDGNVLGFAHATKPFHDEKPVLQRPAHIHGIGREHEIQKDQIRFFRGYNACRPRTVSSHKYLVATGVQKHGQRFQDDLVVIHHQYLLKTWYVRFFIHTINSLLI